MPTGSFARTAGPTPTGPTAQQLQSERYRLQTQAAQREAQEYANRQEREGMATQAARLSLSNAQRLSADQNSRITTTGNDQEISNYGGGSSSYGSGSSYGGSGSGGGAGGGAPMDTSAIESLIQRYSPSPVSAPVAPPQVAAPVPPTRAAGTSKAFANAKNTSGRQGTAAVKALHDLMTRRGMSDSGFEVEGEADILGDVANFNSDAAFRSDMADDERSWDAAQLGYQGALGQRSGDMGFATSGYQGQLAQRGQDLDRMNMILSYLAPRRY